MGIFLLLHLYAGGVRKSITSMRGWKFYWSFVILTAFTSLFFSNVDGLGKACLFGFVGIYIGFYKQNIDSNTFKKITGLFIGLSITMALVGLFQYITICDRLNIAWYTFDIQEKPQDRVFSVYMNANLYATICEYIILLCLYRYVKTKNIKSRIYYVFVALLNLVMIYLTGCRTAFIPFVVVVPVFFWLYKKKDLFYLALIGECTLLVLILIFPDILPRMDNFSTFISRQKIWNGAFEMIKDNWLFGRGSSTYGLLYKIYNSHPAPHCHNIFIDLFCSYGVVGAGLLFGYIKKNIKRYLKSGLVIGSILIAIIHGLLDCTLAYPMTFLLFMIFINSEEWSCEIEKEQKKNKIFSHFADDGYFT